MNNSHYHTTTDASVATRPEDRPVTYLMRAVRPISVTDDLGTASALMRASTSPALPIVDGDRLVGLVTEAEIARALMEASQSGAAERARYRSVAELMTREIPYASDTMSISQALDLLASSGAAALPIIGSSGMVLGIVFRSDLVAYLCNVLRPPTIAGMATPLGVYLTSGALRAGAGDLGLFLSGVMLMLLNDAARLGLWLLAILARIGLHVDALAYLASPAISLPNRLDLIHYAALFVQAGLLLYFLKMSPLAQYHAAEHQVVNAIETGQPLIPEMISRMSRVHPRCGTNLAAAAVVFIMITQRFTGPIAMLVALAVVLLFWRAIGGYLQYAFTTRSPREKHIASGIEAGKELLAKYQSNLDARPTRRQRIWNMGFLQVAAGVAVMLLLEELITGALGIVVPV